MTLPHRGIAILALPAVLCLGACEIEPPRSGELSGSLELLLQVVPTLDDPAPWSASAVLPFADGGFAVGDRWAKQVLIFDRGGRRIAQFGREGRGPGEFRSVSSLLRHEEGLAVFDARSRRFEVVLLDGTPVRSFPTPGGMAAFDAQSHGDGGVLLTTAVPLGGIYWRGRLGNSAGSWSKALAGDLLEPHVATMAVVGTGPSGRLYLGWGRDTYSIRVLGPDGEYQHTLTREVSPRRYTDAERAAIESAAIRFGGPSAARFLPDLEFAPLFEAIEEDGCGRVWVRNGLAGPGRTSFDVFSEAGDFLGGYTVALELLLFEISDSLMYAVVKGEFLNGVVVLNGVPDCAS